MSTKIVFFGTPELAVPFLEALNNEPDFDVTAVITQPDRPVGRKQILTPSPIKELALAKKIPILQPENLKNNSNTPALQHPIPPADLFIVVAYGLLIPQKVLDLPKLGCINVHPSLLPKYRGPSPIQSAIANGDTETGISIMLLDKGMDSGPILAQKKFPLTEAETQISLIKKIKQLGPTLLIETIKKYTVGKIKPVPQDNSQATLCKLLDRESGHINWSHPAEEIERLVRAYQPWPGTWTIWNKNNKKIRIKILKVKIAQIFPNLEFGQLQKIDEPPSPSFPPHQASKDTVGKRSHLFCVAKNGSLEILELQPEGKSIMTAEEFLRGYKNINETIWN